MQQSSNNITLQLEFKLRLKHLLYTILKKNE